MSCEQTLEWACGNIYIRPVKLAKIGDVCGNHAHNFDHVSILLRGGIAVRKDGTEIYLTAPAHLLIEKGIAHEIIALEDDTEFWCVYAHRTPQGEVVQNYTGWKDAYR